MTRVRVLGPRRRLPEVLSVLQDLGLLHLASPPAVLSLETLALSRREERHRRHLARAGDDAAAALERLAPYLEPAPRPRPAASGDLPCLVRAARRARREVEALVERRQNLAGEQALLSRYRGFFAAFAALLASEPRWPNATAYHVVLRAADEAALGRLRAALAEALGDAFELRSRALAGGELALLVLVTSGAAPLVERLLAAARVEELPVPAGYGPTLAAAMPRVRARLAALPGELADADAALRRAAAGRAPQLRAARRAVADLLAQLASRAAVRATQHAFVLEGWLPRDARGRLEARLRQSVGDEVAVAELGREEWRGEEAPVVLRNPRLFRPFEALVRLMPLPRYGSIDPTPFVAVFFPMLFGLILGDVGYGLLLAVLGLALRRRSRPGSTLRSLSEIAGACAAFAGAFGLLFGELFGDFGRALGLRPLAFDRQEAILPFFGLAVAVGCVHVLIGLVLGAVTAAREAPRHAVGRGLTAAMVVLLLVALGAAARVLPSAFFTPAVVALLIAFPLLVLTEGLLAPLEFLATLGSVLSYARVMALGTASVMLAMVANRMAGALGSAVVGVIFALLFHLVNFALGLFSPAIHALRLHYVEFFGKFYSPGGVEYRPFAHWSPSGPLEVN